MAEPLMAENAQKSMPSTLTLHYDRGTIVIRGNPNNINKMQLPGLTWDPRIAAHRAPACLYEALSRHLDQHDVPRSDRVMPPPMPIGKLRGPELRPYQQEALRSWLVAGNRGVVVLPTGSGKTYLALAAMAKMACSTLILVPTRVLLAQWVEAIRKFYDGAVGAFGDGVQTLHAITVATFESAFRHMDDFGHQFSLLVVDEVHHFGSGLRAEALEMSVAPARLGLTATPPGQPEALQRLDRLVGPMVCHLRIADLSGQHLAPFQCIRKYLNLNPTEWEAYSLARQIFSRAFRAFCNGGGSQWQDFVRVAVKSREGREALKGYRDARRIVSSAEAKMEEVSHLLSMHHDDRTFIFTADNQAAYALSTRLLVPAITCHISRGERASILKGLATGLLRAVVSAQVLNEGIDLPEARVGIIVGGSLGGREHVQRVGRLLRPQAGKEALVYELVAQGTFEVNHANLRQLSLLA